jgi:hypothetical protein
LQPRENSCTMTVFRLPLRICRFIIYSAGNNCDMQGDFFLRILMKWEY